MLQKLIGILILLKCLPSLASFPNIDKIIYQPLLKVKDIAVDMEAEELSELIEDKLFLKNMPTKWSIYRLNGVTQVDIDQIKLNPVVLQYRLRNNLINKAQHAWTQSITEYLKGLTFLKKEGDWYHYTDKTGLLDISALKVRFEKGLLTLELARKNSTEKINYFYERTKWSDGKFVLKSIVTEIFEGKENTQEVLNYDYTKLTKKLWLLSKLSVATTQNHAKESKYSRKRTLNESYSFTNYRIDKNFASRWFNSHKY